MEVDAEPHGPGEPERVEVAIGEEAAELAELAALALDAQHFPKNKPARHVQAKSFGGKRAMSSRMISTVGPRPPAASSPD